MFYKGFYQDFFNLKESVDNEYMECFDKFAFLSDICDAFEHEKLKYINLEFYLHGICDEFAMLLSKRYGYQIKFAFCDDKFIHSYCQKDNYLIDVRGITDDEELFFSEFNMNGTTIVTCNTVEDAYRTIKDFFENIGEEYKILKRKQLELLEMDRYMDNYYLC